MKTKFKFLLVTCVIAAAAITGFNFVQNGSNINVSLADIAVMAKADGETPPHSATYDCTDASEYQAEETWQFRYYGRVCGAPSCGRYWYKGAFNPQAECTVYYNF